MDLKIQNYKRNDKKGKINIINSIYNYVLSNRITRRLSLVVEFLLWVQEVASSILAVAPLCWPLGLVV